jgi:hypothetical protein
MYYLEKDRAAGMLMGESREWPRALTGFDLVLKSALLHMKEGGAVTSCQRLVVASNIIATVGGQMSLSIKFSANFVNILEILSSNCVNNQIQNIFHHVIKCLFIII